MLTLFLSFTGRPEPDGQAIAAVAEIARKAPGLDRALLHTPASARDPYLDDGPPPALVLQLYFHDVGSLEAASAEAGALQRLFESAGPLAHAAASQQAMLVRDMPVDGPAPPDPACTYLVAYPGPAADPNAWHAHYLAHHPPIMRRFPGIRAIEICTRIDWCSFLPCPRDDHMQRNKVVFDDPAGLAAALASPVRYEMRADFHRFPTFEGGSTHWPMVTRTVRP